MNEYLDTRSQIGLELLAASVLAGGLGSPLLAGAAGASATVWLLAVLAGACLLARRWHAPLLRNGRGVVLVLAALACTFAWRDAALLNLAAAGGLLVAAAFGVALTQRTRRTPLLALVDEADTALAAGLRALRDAPRYVQRGIDWAALRATAPRDLMRALGRGLLLALPAVAAFGVLLAAADALFADLLARAVAVDLAALSSWLLRSAMLAWLVAAFLYGVLCPSDAVPSEREPRRLGGVEATVVTVAVDLLFGAFVLLQARYLFGGAAYIEAASGLTLAAYARHGFFELVGVVGLAVPLLLFLQRRATPETTRQRRLFRGAAFFQGGLLLAMLASAAGRMALYVQSYGLTELRLYTSVFMGWLALVVVSFGVWVLWRDAPRRFAHVAALTGLLAVGGLHAANPDAVVVRTNVAHAGPGGEVDVHYLARELSADAVPALLEALPALQPDDRRQLAAMLLERWRAPGETGWRAANRSRLVARQQVAAAEHLEDLAAEEPVILPSATLQ